MVTTIKRYLLLVLSALFISSAAFANNVTVSNVTLTGQDATNDLYLCRIRHQLGELVAGRAAPRNNWDAVWVFVKYKVGKRCLATCHPFRHGRATHSPIGVNNHTVIRREGGIHLPER